MNHSILGQDVPYRIVHVCIIHDGEINIGLENSLVQSIY